MLTTSLVMLLVIADQLMVDVDQQFVDVGLVSASMGKMLVDVVHLLADVDQLLPCIEQLWLRLGHARLRQRHEIGSADPMVCFAELRRPNAGLRRRQRRLRCVFGSGHDSIFFAPPQVRHVWAGVGHFHIHAHAAMKAFRATGEQSPRGTQRRQPGTTRLRACLLTSVSSRPGLCAKVDKI